MDGDDVEMKIEDSPDLQDGSGAGAGAGQDLEKSDSEKSDTEDL